MPDTKKINFEIVPPILNGNSGPKSSSLNKKWDDIVVDQIKKLIDNYGIGNKSVNNVLKTWHKNVTLDYKANQNFTPHVNGFYMIFMVHGPWYDDYIKYVSGENPAGLSKLPKKSGKDGKEKVITFKNPNSYFNMLATDIDIPDLTEEYVSVSSRLRNSFVPSRNYFVSDFSISYIENINLDIMRYHEAWHKYLNLIRRGEVNPYPDNNGSDCLTANRGYFLDIPFSNAVWVAVFKPFTTDIQMLVKLVGVMPVTMPLKQVIGNRSQSKMTVLNISYKAADLLYKFYNNTNEFLEDAKNKGALASSFNQEVINGN